MKNDLEGAIAEYTKAIEIDSRQTEIYLNRGHLKLLVGRAAEADLDFAESLRIAGARGPAIEALIKEYKDGPTTQKRLGDR